MRRRNSYPKLMRVSLSNHKYVLKTRKMDSAAGRLDQIINEYRSMKEKESQHQEGLTVFEDDVE